jgi:hypothetical protein
MTIAIIWRNEFRMRELPGSFAADPPPGTIEITRVEEAGGRYHIWYAPVPAVPAPDGDGNGPGSWWKCPNEPPCPHGGVVHDVHNLEDQVPRCCVEDCPCGARQR